MGELGEERRRTARFRLWRYEGTIDFRGEGGYSEAHAVSVPGDVEFLAGLVCGGSGVSEGFGGRSPGALLTVAGGHGSAFRFSARKNSPSRPSRFAAAVREQRGKIRIERIVGALAGPSAFRFDVAAGSAWVGPPAPFAGEATYARVEGRSSWHGNLTVDFPGRAEVRLTGAGTHAAMIRAVQNPGHPFNLSTHLRYLPGSANRG
jgi:hypothetical protein